MTMTPNPDYPKACEECSRANGHTHSGSGHVHEPGIPRCAECQRAGAHVHQRSGHHHRTAPPTKREAAVAAAKGEPT